MSVLRELEKLCLRGRGKSGLAGATQPTLGAVPNTTWAAIKPSSCPGSSVIQNRAKVGDKSGDMRAQQPNDDDSDILVLRGGRSEVRF